MNFEFTARCVIWIEVNSIEIPECKWLSEVLNLLAIISANHCLNFNVFLVIHTQECLLIPPHELDVWIKQLWNLTNSVPK